MVREMLAVTLSGEGFSIITAEDGRVGLDRAWCERPDLILTDIEMPEMDGIQMICRLRQAPELQTIPVVVLSAVHQELLTKAVSLGAHAALKKPIELKSLITLIRQILRGPAD
jgi:CheY-like chemotaxis protein